MTATIERFTIAKPDDRAEWLAARAPYFNASSAAVLWDRHPFQTAADYAVEKITGVGQDVTAHMRRGTHLEAGIANWFADEMGWQLVEPGELLGVGPILATLDRIIMQTGVPVEIKCPSGRKDEPEGYWLDQCQAQMLCADADTMHLVWMDASMQLQHVEVDADPAMQADLLDRADRFMAAIEFDIVPDWVRHELRSDHIIALHPEPAGEVELDGDELQKALRYDELRAEKSRIEDEMSALRDDLALVLGDAEHGMFGGAKVVSFKATKGRSSFDTTLFRQTHPELAAQYTKTGAGSRRFLVSVPD